MKIFRYALPQPKHQRPIGMLGVWSKLIGLISGEFLLNQRDNGGAIIALRSLLCTISIFSIVVTLNYYLLQPEECPTYWGYYRNNVIERPTWYGAIFAVAYAALYARFSSQWVYLANLYNQIKQASLCSIDPMHGQERLAEWKAAFIEDAEYLHLAKKENFVSIIHAWMQQEDVEKAYKQYTPGGEERWNRLGEGIRTRYDQINRDRAVS